MDKPEFLAMAIAGYFADSFGFIAHHNLGSSADHISVAAMASATVIALLLAIDHFGKKEPRRSH